MRKRGPNPHPSGQIDADRTIGNNAASEAERLLLDKEFVTCSNQTTDKWVWQVAQLLAVVDSYIDDNACHNKEQQAETAEPSLITTFWKLYYSCEAFPAEGRLESATSIGNSTSFPDVRAYGQRIERSTEWLEKNDAA